MKWKHLPLGLACTLELQLVAEQCRSPVTVPSSRAAVGGGDVAVVGIDDDGVAAGSDVDVGVGGANDTDNEV